MIRRIISILLLFLMVAGSFVEAVQRFMDIDLGLPQEYLNLGVLGMALLALFILSGGSSRKDNQNKIYVGDKDSILITEGAIISMVKNALVRIEAVKGSDIQVRYGKEKKIIVKVALLLEANSSIAEVNRLVDQYIHEAFAEVLEEKVQAVEVTIKGFRETPKQNTIK